MNCVPGPEGLVPLLAEPAYARLGRGLTPVAATRGLRGMLPPLVFRPKLLIF